MCHELSRGVNSRAADQDRRQSLPLRNMIKGAHPPSNLYALSFFFLLLQTRHLLSNSFSPSPSARKDGRRRTGLVCLVYIYLHGHGAFCLLSSFVHVTCELCSVGATPRMWCADAPIFVVWTPQVVSWITWYDPLFPCDRSVIDLCTAYFSQSTCTDKDFSRAETNQSKHMLPPLVAGKACRQVGLGLKMLKPCTPLLCAEIGHGSKHGAGPLRRPLRIPVSAEIDRCFSDLDILLTCEKSSLKTSSPSDRLLLFPP